MKRLTIAVVLLVLGATAVAAASSEQEGQAGVASPWSFDASAPIPEGDVISRARDEGISTDEAIHRFRVEDAAASLEPTLGSRWPATYAGLWLTHEPFAVNIAFTAGASSNVGRLQSDFLYPQELRPIPAAVSLATLHAVQETMIQDRALLKSGPGLGSHLPNEIRATNGDYDLDIDIPTGKLIVAVESASSSLTNAFRSAYGERVLVREGLMQTSACTQDDCRWAMMGGLRLDIPGGDVCSSAFTASIGTVRYVLSAGHCLSNTGEVDRYHSGEYYGFTGASASSQSGPVDAERIRRSTSSSFRESSKFWVSGENPRFVQSYMTHASMQINEYIGKSGATTGTTRGHVLSKDLAPSSVPYGRDFVSADYCAYAGDSGAAVWRGTTA